MSVGDYTTDPKHLSSTIAAIVEQKVQQAGWEAESRAYRVANELTNATAKVLAGQRHGRKYIVPGTGRVKYNKRKHTATITYKHYTASAPGEPPAARTGLFRMSWKRRTYVDARLGNDRNIHSVAESDLKVGKYLLGELLEGGTSRMAPRPYKQKVIDMAYPKALRIYKEPYFRR